MNDFILNLLFVSCMNTILFFILRLLGRAFKCAITQKEKYYSALIVICGFLSPIFCLMPPANHINKVVSKSSVLVDYSESILSHSTLATVLLQENNLLKEFSHEIFCGWVIGMVIFALLSIVQYFKNRWILEKQMTTLSDKATLEIYHSVCSKLKLRIIPILFNCECITTPALIKVKCHRILLPMQCFFDEKALELIFYHELVHYKRKDIWYKNFLNIVSVIHWFNPFFILIKREMERTCELSCDEAVLKCITESDKVKYGDLILQTAKYRCSNNTTLLWFAKGNSDKKLIKERMTLIVERSDKMVVKRIFVQVIAWIVMVGLSAAMTFVYSGTKTDMSKNNHESEKISINQEEIQRDTAEGKNFEIAIEDFDRKILSQVEFENSTLEEVWIGSNNPKVRGAIIEEVYACTDWINSDWTIWVSMSPSGTAYEGLKAGTVTLIFE